MQKSLLTVFMMTDSHVNSFFLGKEINADGYHCLLADL